MEISKVGDCLIPSITNLSHTILSNVQQADSCFCSYCFSLKNVVTLSRFKFRSGYSIWQRLGEYSSLLLLKLLLPLSIWHPYVSLEMLLYG